jgi:pimeloyl-ACP methyl ester carboxylesterase
MHIKSTMLATLIIGQVLTASTSHAIQEEMKTIATRPGVTQPFLLVRPDRAPVASVILFAGGHGRLALSERGIGWGTQNFLVRTRALFAQQAFLVAVVDAPSDIGAEGLWHFRTGEAHAQDIADVIGFLRQTVNAPVWLIGTSAGTLSAANAAARIRRGGADGLVVTSSIMRSSRVLPYALTDVRLEDIAIPTLFVHHKDDSCRSTPYEDIPGAMKKLTRAPKVELLTFTGGDPPRSEPCEALSAHGFLGLEPAVIGAISAWIKATSGVQ